VTDYLRDCGLVVMFMGQIRSENGLAWELKSVLDGVSAEKIIFVLPPVEDAEARSRWESFRNLSHGLLPPFEGHELAAGFDRARKCRVIREIRDGKKSGARYENAVSSLIQAECVETLVVSC